jgi:dipeptidyl aminopeptidase/acylaminoacyl peptidase
MVHEYGGGDYAVSQDTVFFANFSDQRLYRLQPGAEPEPITPPERKRYADMVVDQQRQRLICVCEDHTHSDHDPANTLVSVPLDGSGKLCTLVAGNDFYSTPRLSPDGSKLCWLTWNHPNMPWDGCELWVGSIDANGYVSYAEHVAGGESESIFQPQWSPDGVLYFVSDRSGWWNIYRLNADGTIEPMHEMQAEFGSPQWVFGMSTYGFASAQTIICRYTEGQDKLASLDTRTKKFTPIPVPYTVISDVQVTPEHVFFIGASPSEFRSVVALDLQSRQTTVLKRSSTLALDPGIITEPQLIEFPTENGQTAYGYYYPPRNAAYEAPEGELPPLQIWSHGGPTSQSVAVLDLSKLYWTSRGFAILDVNYGGSTGYGRAYRERLKGQWGIVDIDDCVNGALYLANQGLVDKERLTIRGGSAGGYTTLGALTFRDVFKAGASFFGVSDIIGLAEHTHKFESRYTFGLVGPYPECADLYRERSPLNHVEQLSCPMILFQGLDDKIVTPDQSQKMVEALRARKIPVAYIEFEGEGHGFRRADSIKRAQEAELYFYAKVFGFELAEQVEPVEIENLHS